MTTQKSFKRLVRARMEKTGERYAAARAALLTAEDPLSRADVHFPRPGRQPARDRRAATGTPRIVSR